MDPISIDNTIRVLLSCTALLAAVNEVRFDALFRVPLSRSPPRRMPESRLLIF
jgi:hypothetical protein